MGISLEQYRYTIGKFNASKATTHMAQIKRDRPPSAHYNAKLNIFIYILYILYVCLYSITNTKNFQRPTQYFNW